MTRCLTQEEVIRRFKAKHGDKYDYSKFVYAGNKAKGIIICPIHGEWSTTPSNHYKYGCIHCGYVSRNKKKTKNPNKLIKELRNIYGHDYDYSKVSYKGNHEKIKLVCNIDNHGLFKAKPAHLLAGHGCPKCGHKKQGESSRIDLKGKRLGKLTVIEYAYSSKKNVYWKVRCACGREPFLVTRDYLVSPINPRKACVNCSLRDAGLRKSKINWEKIKGMRFGKLTIIKSWGSNETNQRLVIANCDCGGQKICKLSDMQQGKVSSCGCMPKGTGSFKAFSDDEALANRDTIIYYVEVMNRYHKLGITYEMSTRSRGDYTNIFYERILPRAKARAVEAIALSWTIEFKPKLTSEMNKWGGSSELRKPMDIQETINMIDQLSEEAEDMTWEEFWVKYGLTTGAEPENVSIPKDIT